jgi:putative long chain acyl-CoA synthase
MPRALWTEALEVLAPARIVEFWTTGDANAVLVNLGARKPGCAGRPLPGSAPLRVVRADPETGALELDSHGLAQPCPVDTPGVLLAATDPEAADRGLVSALRGVFEQGDAWINTGELFRVDPAGDYWRIDSLAALVHRPHGPGSPAQVRDALESGDQILTTVAYPIDGGEAGALLGAAVVGRAGARVSDADLRALLRDLDPLARPDYVRVVGNIDYSRLYRPVTAHLAKQGLVPATGQEPAWMIDVRGRPTLLSPVATPA